jgi:molecular chaperone Hsp33
MGCEGEGPGGGSFSPALSGVFETLGPGVISLWRAPYGCDCLWPQALESSFSNMQPVEDFTTIESVFIRKRNALLLRGQFTPVFTDYYLHLMQHGIRHVAELDGMLKDSLAMLALHLTARPWAETIAWTVNLRAPRVNLFVTGGSVSEEVTGRIFTEDVREPDRNFFYSQTTAPGMGEPRTSMLEVDGRDPLRWISQFYDQSEQRPARAFRFEDDHFALVAAQPDCDMEWFEALNEQEVSRIDETEETKLLETRRFRFHCGCTLDKILPVLGGWRERLDELFEDADTIKIQCPRCAAGYRVTRDMI